VLFIAKVISYLCPNGSLGGVGVGKAEQRDSEYEESNN